MVKAEELIKQQKEKESKKFLIFDKIYNMIEKKINIASQVNFYFTWYQVPEFLIGMPIYSVEQCQIYVQQKLKQNGFETEFYMPNIILIKWFPK